MRPRLNRILSLTTEDMGRLGYLCPSILEAKPAPDPKCDVCGYAERVTHRGGIPIGLARDHCHKTGRVRGYLCQRCNLAIGLFSDDVERMQSAIKYLNDKK